MQRHPARTPVQWQSHFTTLATLLIVMPLVGFAPRALARESADMSLEISSDKQGNDAKQDAFDQAIEEATRRWTEELLGPERAAAQWTHIKGRLLKNSSRYILFIKGGTPAAGTNVPPTNAATSAPTSNSAGTKINVQLRIAPDALEAMLREFGVYGGTSVRVLALIRIKDSRGAEYLWWTDGAGRETAGSVAQQYFKKVYAHLKTQFQLKSLYVLDPLAPSLRMSIPAAYRSENLKRDDQATLAQYLKADVILTGKITISRVRSEFAESRLEYDLQLWQTKNGRGLSEVSRTETLTSDQVKIVGANLDAQDKRVFGELAQKLAEAAGDGNLNLGIVRLVVNGDLNYREQNDLRKQLIDVREVRALRERLFEPGRVTYEAETSSSPTELAQALQRGRPLHTLDVEATPDNGLVLTPRKGAVR